MFSSNRKFSFPLRGQTGQRMFIYYVRAFGLPLAQRYLNACWRSSVFLIKSVSQSSVRLDCPLGGSAVPGCDVRNYG